MRARLFAEAGAERLHVVDLDGAFAGKSVNGDAVRGIVAAFPGHVQLGGGIRTPASVEAWFDAGVARVVIGTAALEDPDFVRDMARAYPGGIVVAVDAKDGMVATGWADVSTTSATDLARRFEDAGVAAVLFTDVGRDGLLKGCNVEATVDLARWSTFPSSPRAVSRGSRTSTSWRSTRRAAGWRVITGRALYDGRLDLAAALSVAAAA
ncbi:HisA/HisF-related TIM barrel protein [Sphingomonas sp. MMS24-JH45]